MGSSVGVLDFRRRRKIPPLQKACGLQLRRCDPRVRDRATLLEVAQRFLANETNESGREF